MARDFTYDTKYCHYYETTSAVITAMEGLFATPSRLPLPILRQLLFRLNLHLCAGVTKGIFISEKIRFCKAVHNFLETFFM